MQEFDDRLDEKIIRSSLRDASISPKIYQTIDSTNMELKRCIRSGEVPYRLILAEEQTLGRGRLGRTFESPVESGIYMSLMIVPEFATEDAVLITSAAAVAVCRAVCRLTSAKPLIKWVNDIFVNEKKVCGILAEAVSDPEGRLNIVLGIGINVVSGKNTFSEETTKVAGALYKKTDDNCGNRPSRNLLAAAVINEFCYIYEKIQAREFIDDYRRYSMVIGKAVRYFENDIWKKGMAVDIDNNGALLIRDENGDVHLLKTGEITLRLA